MTTRGKSPHHRPSRQRGFTLLEVLLTLVLSATLLTGLWSMFSVYLHLFETGQARAEQAQLARALLQQISDDLQSAIEDSPTRDAADEASGSVRRFGLLGSQHALRLDVLQVIPREESPPLDADVSEGSPQTSTRQVPELRTVFYTFEDPNAVESNEEDLAEAERLDKRPGLTRRELDYETPSTDAEESRVERPFSGITDSPLEIDPEDDSMIWVPEVVSLEFRYFDGSGWSNQWNSLQRKSLPVAVEAVMRVSSFEESASDTVERKPRGAVHRLVIDMPSAKKHRPTRRPAPRPAPRAFEAPRPLPAPRPAVPLPRPSVPAADKSDQWMRVGL